MASEVIPIYDAAKKSLYFPKILLDAVNLWPERKMFKKTTFSIMVVLCVLLLLVQIAFMVQNFTDIAVITNTLSTISVTTQALTKIPTLYFFGRRLQIILRHIWYDFWPADMLGNKIEIKSKSISTSVILCCLSVYIPAFIYHLMLFTVAFAKGDYSLAFSSEYPFDWKTSPTYELILVGQLWINLYICVTAICGHDFLILALTGNILTQFVLLEKVVNQIGSGNEKELNNKISSYKKDEDEENRFSDETTKLLINCAQHHRIVMGVCEQLEIIFTTSAFIQLFCSINALCVACFLITMVNINISQLFHLIMYVAGHISQLFIYCVTGNELSNESNNLPLGMYMSQWYEITDLKFRKNMLMAMQGSNKVVKFTALSIVILNYSSFIAVIKMTFSIYQLLSRSQGRA